MDRQIAQDRQYLNAIDRLMLVVNDGLVSVGHYGFLCQTHVWFSTRIDVEKLHVALQRLNRHYPVITSRLRSPTIGRPFWHFREGASVELHECELDRADETAVWAYGEKLCDGSYRVRENDPIQWHLLHLPDGKDVLVVLFIHALMDGKAPEHVLKTLNRLWDADGELPVANPQPDELTRHLKTIPKLRRVRLAFRRLAHEMRFAKKAVMPTEKNKRWSGRQFRILVRQMSVEQTAIVTRRVRTLCGFPNLAPAVLTAVFRAIGQLESKPLGSGMRLRTDVPLNLRPPGVSEPLFRNFMSFIKMGATREELKDSDALVKSLNARMRDEIRRGMDVGALEMMDAVAPYPWLSKPILMRSAKRVPSLGFGFLGPVLPDLKLLGNAPISWLYTMNTAISPPGITLQAHQFDGKLNLVTTYIGETISDELAQRFCTLIIDDLIGATYGK